MRFSLIVMILHMNILVALTAGIALVIVRSFSSVRSFGSFAHNIRKNIIHGLKLASVFHSPMVILLSPLYEEI